MTSKVIQGQIYQNHSSIFIYGPILMIITRTFFFYFKTFWLITTLTYVLMDNFCPCFIENCIRKALLNVSACIENTILLSLKHIVNTIHSPLEYPYLRIKQNVFLLRFILRMIDIYNAMAHKILVHLSFWFFCIASRIAIFHFCFSFGLISLSF